MYKLTGSDVIFNSLKNRGIKSVFCYSGGAIMHLIDKLYDKTNAIIAGDFNITLRDNERISMVRSKLESDMGNYLNIKIDGVIIGFLMNLR